MRLRDHDKGDLALAALTLAVAVAGAAVEGSRWLRGRRRPAAPPTTTRSGGCRSAGGLGASGKDHDA